MSDKLIINLPFEGFYDSKYSGEVDHTEEREAEWAEERQEEEGIPSMLRLKASDFAEALFDCTDYSACYRSISKAYVDAFNNVASEFLGVPLGLTWESMDSPREYNFTTDRVYAHISVETVTALFTMSAAEGHKRLREAIKERFTSYDGFISGYPNTLATWLDKDVTDWDHNELCTLLGAMLGGFEEQEGDRLDWAVYNVVCDGDGIYSEWSNAVDWAKYEAAIAEKRADLEAELREDDPDFVAPPVRCDRTIDMFTGRAG
jgi:hypothetical protein